MIKFAAKRGMKAVLLAMFAGGTLLGTSCGWVDVRHNVVAGALSFVKGYTADTLAVWIPPAGTFVGGD